MHGYSKITQIHSSRSKSVDFSDLTTLPQTQKTNENISRNHVHETEESKQSGNLEAKKSNNGGHFSSEMEAEVNGSESNESKQKCSLKLSRNFSVSSTTGSQRFMRLERQSSKKAIQSAVKRAFSVSRSSSVSDKYARIHGQLDSSPLNEVVEGSNNDEMQSRSMKKEKTSGGKRILKAWKRLFGL